MDSNSGILSENTKANYTERYDSLLKMKNHVILHTYPNDVNKYSMSEIYVTSITD